MRVKIAADAPMHLIANKLGEAAQANIESEASESERDLARASTITLSIEEDRLGRLGRSNGRGWERLSCGCLALCHFHVVRRRRRYRPTPDQKRSTSITSPLSTLLHPNTHSSFTSSSPHLAPSRSISAQHRNKACCRSPGTRRSLSPHTAPPNMHRHP
ncbi:hypothetical protein L1887_50187 [Cichorium endivia]|nr:hypothetical protein L1887_50187 [Cichorium endivia]